MKVEIVWQFDRINWVWPSRNYTQNFFIFAYFFIDKWPEVWYIIIKKRDNKTPAERRMDMTYFEEMMSGATLEDLFELAEVDREDLED